jgi:hypothetical protein
MATRAFIGLILFLALVLPAEAGIKTCDSVQTLDEVMESKNITHTRMKTIKKGLIWHYRIDFKSSECKKWSMIQDVTTKNWYSEPIKMGETDFNTAMFKLADIEQTIRDTNNLGMRKQTFTEKMVLAAEKQDRCMENGETWLCVWMKNYEPPKCIWANGESACLWPSGMITTSIKR